MQETDLTKMSYAELSAEMKRREKAQKDDRKAYKELVNETVPGIIQNLKKLSSELSEAKKQVFQDVNDLMKLKERAYAVKETQKSHTLTTDDGDSLKIGYHVRDGWDDTVNSGIAKVSNFIDSLAKDEDSAKLVKTINRLLKRDAKGNLNSNRVLELQKMVDEFDNAEFEDGVKIIMDAYSPVPTVYFIEASERDQFGKEVSIPLSISTVDLPESARFDYFKNPKLKEL